MTVPHDVHWTSEKVTRFWNEYSLARSDAFFSADVAPSLAAWIAKNARPGKFVVDVGCGSGHLLSEMKKLGYQPFGIDSSPEALRLAASRIGAENVALGTVTDIPIQNGRAEGIFLVETIEHVLDDDMGPMFAEIRRVLGHGWPLVITTPNSEDIAAASVTCPDCGARFHPMQHVRSWTPQSLSTFLHEQGFGRVKTVQTRLPPGRGFSALARKVFYRVRGRRPSLLAVARM
jgi:2-polyprenyl-3-methyl-5-hydroxy-6-metoxy-1,4-benzoquinol methylase